MSIETILQLLNQYKLIVGILVVFTIFSFIVSGMQRRKMKSDSNNFLKNHPDAAKIYMYSRAGITNEEMQILTVDDENPNKFYDGGKWGIYVVPGLSELQVNYSYQRPGVMHKTVTTSTGVVKKAVETEPNKSYMLSFDRKAEQFVFEEYSK